MKLMTRIQPIKIKFEVLLVASQLLPDGAFKAAYPVPSRISSLPTCIYMSTGVATLMRFWLTTYMIPDY